MRPRLRLFTGEENGSVAEPQVSVSLQELTKVLLEAAEWDKTWVKDFENDEVQVSADLYEIISAFNHLRPSA